MDKTYMYQINGANTWEVYHLMQQGWEVENNNFLFNIPRETLTEDIEDVVNKLLSGYEGKHTLKNVKELTNKNVSRNSNVIYPEPIQLVETKLIREYRRAGQHGNILMEFLIDLTINVTKEGKLQVKLNEVLVRPREKDSNLEEKLKVVGYDEKQLDVVYELNQEYTEGLETEVTTNLHDYMNYLMGEIVYFLQKLQHISYKLIEKAEEHHQSLRFQTLNNIRELYKTTT